MGNEVLLHGIRFVEILKTRRISKILKTVLK